MPLISGVACFEFPTFAKGYGGQVSRLLTYNLRARYAQGRYMAFSVTLIKNLMAEKLVTGILWWKPKQWEKAKKMSSDSHVFDETYQDWKEGAEEALKNFHDLGIKVYKIEIELDELVQWCKNQKIPLDSKARSRFVSMKVQKLHESQSN